MEATLKTTPRDATHWSVRTMAEVQKVSPSTVHRVWTKHKLQPHRVESFKFSTDPEFAFKVRDIVGLYLNPPDKALILSVDEKSQIQALDRTQPILPSAARPAGAPNPRLSSATEQPLCLPPSTAAKERLSPMPAAPSPTGVPALPRAASTRVSIRPGHPHGSRQVRNP